MAAELATLGLTLLQAKAFAEAEPLVREALAIREMAQPNDWSTFNSKSLLGGALLGEKKYAEAEPLLLDGYRGMKEREAKIPPAGKVRLTEATERLAELYDALGKKDEATKWRKELQSRKDAAGAARLAHSTLRSTTAPWENERAAPGGAVAGDSGKVAYCWGCSRT